MQNLDQLRAAAALTAAASTSRQAVSKLPSMILQNGLLAATAFATEGKDSKPKRPEMSAAMNATADYLAHPDLGISLLAGKNNAAKMTAALSSAAATSLDLPRPPTRHHRGSRLPRVSQTLRHQGRNANLTTSFDHIESRL